MKKISMAVAEIFSQFRSRSRKQIHLQVLKRRKRQTHLEDDERHIKMYKRVFADFSLVIATSIKEGEEKLSELHSQEINPDVFITDYHLPDETSGKFVSRVKRHSIK
jgi:CheY-like chemotaxis protein